MNKGFTEDTIFLFDNNYVPKRWEFIGDAVEVTLSNGGKFCCGTEQLIKSGGDWVEAKDGLRCEVADGVVIVGIEWIGKKKLYDYSIDSEEHEFRILVKGVEIVVHNIPSIGGNISGGGAPVFKGTILYKYVPYNATNIVYRNNITHERKDKRVDLATIVVLGGPFEKIGEKDEAVGGGNQKVGTNN